MWGGGCRLSHWVPSPPPPIKKRKDVTSNIRLASCGFKASNMFLVTLVPLVFTEILNVILCKCVCVWGGRGCEIIFEYFADFINGLIVCVFVHAACVLLHKQFSPGLIWIVASESISCSCTLHYSGLQPVCTLAVWKECWLAQNATNYSVLCPGASITSVRSVPSAITGSPSDVLYVEHRPWGSSTLPKVLELCTQYVEMHDYFIGSLGKWEHNASAYFVLCVTYTPIEYADNVSIDWSASANGLGNWLGGSESVY